MKNLTSSLICLAMVAAPLTSIADCRDTEIWNDGVNSGTLAAYTVKVETESPMSEAGRQPNRTTHFVHFKSERPDLEPEDIFPKIDKIAKEKWPSNTTIISQQVVLSPKNDGNMKANQRRSMMAYQMGGGWCEYQMRGAENPYQDKNPGPPKREVTQ